MEEIVEKKETAIENEVSAKKVTSGNFFKNAFTNYLTVSLSIIGLFFYFLGSFVRLIPTFSAAIAAAWIMFIGWGIVVAGLIMFGIKSIKHKKFEISPEFIFSIISIIIVTL